MIAYFLPLPTNKQQSAPKESPDYLMPIHTYLDIYTEATQPH